MKVSVIIPVLNEVSTVGPLLEALQAIRRDGHEVIIVDGGSTDGTLEAARLKADHIVQTSPGRALQMNSGAEYASGELLWFLHADTHFCSPIHDYIAELHCVNEALWGWFPISLSSRKIIYKIIGYMMNNRARFTRVATGDQGIFVSRQLFYRVGGFPDVPLMEDIRFTSSLKKLQKPVISKLLLGTSSRRWEQNGVFRTILLMWYLRLAHFFGSNPVTLARKYHS